MNETIFEDYFDISRLTKNSNQTLKIPLGVNEAAILEEVEITEKSFQHVLVTGHAGTGKSVFLHSVLGSMLINYTAEQLNIWLSDSGMYEFNRFKNNPPAHIKRVNTSSDPASYIAFVNALEAEINRRFRHIADAEKTSFYSCCCDVAGCPFPRIVVIIDCFNHFVHGLSEVNYRYIEKLENILRCASACGITLIVSIQEATSLIQCLPKSALILFGIRVATKQLSSSYALLFDSGATNLARNLMLGEAIVNQGGLHKVSLLYLDRKIEEKLIQIAVEHDQPLLS